MTNWLERITNGYRVGVWTAAMVQDGVTKGKITQAQADEIIAVSL